MDRPGMAKKTARSLLSLPLLKGLEHGEVEHLAAGATEIPRSRGTVVFREGDVCTGLYFVFKGQVKLSLQTGRGQERVLQLIGDGESFGEAALFLGRRHLTTAEAIADSALLHVTKEVILFEVSRNPEFASRVVRELCRQLHERTLDLQSCTLLSGRQRVVSYLLARLPQGVNGSAVDILLPAKKGIIASRLNLTQEHFSRILHDLATDALIEVYGSTVRIPDVHRLRAEETL